MPHTSMRLSPSTLSFIDKSKSFDENKQNFKNHNVIYRDFPEDELFILKYNKNKADLSDPDIKRCRGLVLDRKTFEIVSVPPEKSVFIEDIDPECVTYQEFCDGTNVNVFYHNGKWQLSTRSSVGANVSFNTSKTFSELFFEALNFNLEDLDKNYMYSFVLEHKDNRIVCPVNENRVVLVELRKRTIEGIELIDVTEVRNICKNVDIHIVKHFEFKSIIEAKKYVEELGIESQGLVLKHENLRTKLRSPLYSHARLVKGNTNNLQERYLTLRFQRQLKIYLSYYPEHDLQFKEFNRTLNILCNEVHADYIKCFVKKELEHKMVRFTFKKMLYDLHKLHIEKSLIITREIVYDHFCAFPIEKQLYLLENFKE